MNAPATVETATPNYVDRDTMYEIERFAYREARLLDDEGYRQWLGSMVAKDVLYQMPVREMRYREDSKTVGSNPGAAAFNDNYDMLSMRISRLETGLVWMEDPRNFLRRYISNIDAEWIKEPNEVKVYSNFIVYRNRRQRDETVVWGGREDVLRKDEGNWKVAHRLVLVDQRVVLDKNLYFFI